MFNKSREHVHHLLRTLYKKFKWYTWTSYKMRGVRRKVKNRVKKYAPFVGLFIAVLWGMSIKYDPAYAQKEEFLNPTNQIEYVGYSNNYYVTETQKLEMLLDGYLEEPYEGKEEIREKIIREFKPHGAHAIKWALFTAWVESNVMRSPVNGNDDHTSWCKGEKGKGSWGLFHFNKCSYKALGGTDIMDPLEQIEIASTLYDERGFYWVNTTRKFRNRHE